MGVQLTIVGGGIGGLAAALGACQSGCGVLVVEQADTFSEIGAGIQLGPNTTSILRTWGLLDAEELGELVARPSHLRARDAVRGHELAVLRLGAAFEQRYGAPYLTVHRADLQHALLRAVQVHPARLQTGTRVLRVHQDARTVRAETSSGESFDADALVGADGLWSRVREYVVAADTPPRATGHLAYRALVRQSDLPQALRTEDVTAWLGTGLHVVVYPVRGGDWLNVVCVVEGAAPRDDLHSWDHPAIATELHGALRDACAPLRDLVHAVPQWRLWMLHDRPPLHGPGSMASGRIALLGDSAHPMLPYLAQGAGMAIEDAHELQKCLMPVANGAMDMTAALRTYAIARWERCARVQRRSRRNATIFHASGLLQWARDLSLRAGGERVLDVPWLYSGA
jgi:salicylate hydroxylase